MFDNIHWLTIAKRQLASLRNEKTIVFAIIIQLVIASFSSFLVIGLVSLYSPDGVGTNQELTIGITGNASNETAPQFEQFQTIDVNSIETYDSAYNSFQSGELDGFVYARYTSQNRISATVYAPESGVKSTLTVVRTKSALKSLEKDRRSKLATAANVTLLNISEDAQASPYLSYTYTVLIPLLIILPAFIGGSIVSDTIIEDRRNGMVEILRSSPATESDIIRGKMSVPFALGPIQVIVWMILVQLNGIPVQNLLPLTVLGTSVTLLSVSLGAFITQYVNNRGKSQFLYSLGLVTILSSTTLLPETPINTIAKLAMNSQTQTTLIMVLMYAVVSIGLYIAIMRNFTLKQN